MMRMNEITNIYTPYSQTPVGRITRNLHNINTESSNMIYKQRHHKEVKDDLIYFGIAFSQPKQ